MWGNVPEITGCTLSPISFGTSQLTPPTQTSVSVLVFYRESRDINSTQFSPQPNHCASCSPAGSLWQPKFVSELLISLLLPPISLCSDSPPSCSLPIMSSFHNGWETIKLCILLEVGQSVKTIGRSNVISTYSCLQSTFVEHVLMKCFCHVVCFVSSDMSSLHNALFLFSFSPVSQSHLIAFEQLSLYMTASQ